MSEIIAEANVPPRPNLQVCFILVSKGTSSLLIRSFWSDVSLQKKDRNCE